LFNTSLGKDPAQKADATQAAKASPPYPASAQARGKDRQHEKTGKMRQEF